MKTNIKPYAIRWKCSVTGRIGTGTILFEKEEAESLAAELNEKHPEINHEAVLAGPPSATLEEAQPGQEALQPSQR